MKKIILATCLLFGGLYADKDLRAPISDDYPNSFSTAQSIDLGSKVTGELEVSGDEDYFKFTLDNNDGVIIDAKSLTKYDYPYLVLYNSSRVELRKEMIGSAYTEHLVFNLSAGTYYIRIYHYNKATLSYTFDLKLNGNDIVKTSLHQATVDYCKNNPEECGISIRDTLTSTTVNNLESGKWHLLGSTKFISNTEVLNSVKYAAIFNDGKWKFYSPDSNIRAQMSAAGYEIFYVIPSNSGVWIKK